MHKQLMNEAVLELAISPNGPLLIKAGGDGGADPTHPDMEFVRTLQQIYIPGSSLKGVIRAHAERIMRSLQTPPGPGTGACDPLNRDKACGSQLDAKEESSARYAKSCFACRLFGNTAIASRVRFADALPAGEVTIEERNGVAIDRVFGSVAVGPFNYEVVTRGTFRTRIAFKNFTLAQLALVGLALRDLGAGRVGLGFGKSRGMGRVTVDWGRLEVRYPLAALKAGRSAPGELRGVGALVTPELRQAYGFPANDRAALPSGLGFEEDGWGSYELVAEGSAQVQAIFREAMLPWRQEVAGG